MPNPYEQTGQSWWDTTQAMEYFGELYDEEGGYPYVVGSAYSDSPYLTGDLFNAGMNFWNETLSPYISDVESEAGINPLGMITGWGHLISPTGNIPGIGEFGGIDPVSHWQIGQMHDIQQGILGSKFGINKKLADRKLGFTGLLGSSNNSLYEDYLSDSNSLQDLAQDSYNELYSDYGETVNLGIDAASLAGAYGSGTYTPGGNAGQIDITDTLYEGPELNPEGGVSGHTWEDIMNNPNFQICVESNMVTTYGLTPEGFSEAANYCYNTADENNIDLSGAYHTEEDYENWAEYNACLDQGLIWNPFLENPNSVTGMGGCE